jgi:hypothetical protein
VRTVAQRNPRLKPTLEACEQFMVIPSGWKDSGARERASSFSSRRSSTPSSLGSGGLPKFKKGIIGENLSAQDMPGRQTGGNSSRVRVGWHQVD